MNIIKKNMENAINNGL